MIQLKTLMDAGGTQNIKVTTDNRCINSVLYGTTIRSASQVERTGEQQQIYKVTTSHGHVIRCTEYHEFITPLGRRQLRMLSEGHELYIQSGEGAWGAIGDYGDGLIIGSFTGDGTTSKTGNGVEMHLDYWNENELCDKVLNFVNKKIADEQLVNTKRSYGPVVAKRCSELGKKRISSIRLSRYFQKEFCTDIKTFKDRVPELVWLGSRELVRGYLAGLFQADGSVQLKDRGTKGSLSIRLAQSNLPLLRDVQILLSNFGIISSIHERRNEQYRDLPDGHGGHKPYLCKSQYELIINRPNSIVFEERISFAGNKQEQLTQLLDKRGRECQKPERFITKIKSIEQDGIEDVYCLNQPSHHCVVVNGVVTGNCGEIWMPPYDCCCLGAVNLHTHVIDGEIDWDLLEETVAMSVRFLDDVLDINNYPLPIIQETCQKYRRIGLGVMGLHDMLLELGLKYSSQAARDVAEKVMDFVKKQAYHASISLAIKKGSFNAFDVDQHVKTGFVKKCLGRRHHRLIKEHGIRNCAILTIAPTGTISIVAGCSSGIEPLFQPVYQRRFNEHKDTHDKMSKTRSMEIVVHPLLKKFMDANRSTKHFQGAHDILPDAHLAMQVSCQKHIDNSISKTINVPEDYSVEQLSKDMRKHVGDLKGITVYRNGSKGQSPLIPLPLSEAKQHLDQEAAVNDCPSGVCEVVKGGS
jgi:ribonucleoside-diphosphate reductase alpha chain